MFRSSLKAQNGSGSTRDAKHHQYASDEIHCTTSVGLTRIELVTSSLSGMRSNQILRLLETLTSLGLLNHFIGGVLHRDRLKSSIKASDLEGQCSLHCDLPTFGSKMTSLLHSSIEIPRFTVLAYTASSMIPNACHDYMS